MNSPQKIRSFIATIPEPAVAQSLIRTGAALIPAQAQRHLRWTAWENLHITLRFLGDLDDRQVTQLSATLTEKLTGYHELALSFDQICWFPSARRPRLIAALIKPNPELHALAIRAELAAEAIGLAPEKKPFRAHLTLARYKGGTPAPKLPETNFSAINMAVTELVLFRSELTRDGPIYSPLNWFPLLRSVKRKG